MNFKTVNRQRRKERQNVSAFAALIASPDPNAFVMPAGGRLRFVSAAGCAAGTTAATVAGAATRTIKTPLLAADGYVIVNWIERGVTVTPAAGFTTEIDIGMGRWAWIAGDPPRVILPVRAAVEIDRGAALLAPSLMLLTLAGELLQLGGESLGLTI